MKANSNMVSGQADWPELYYRHSLEIGAYFESFVQEEFGSEPEPTEVSKKNKDGLSSWVIYI